MKKEQFIRVRGLSPLPLLSGKKPYSTPDTAIFETRWRAKSRAATPDTRTFETRWRVESRAATPDTRTFETRWRVETACG